MLARLNVRFPFLATLYMLARLAFRAFFKRRKSEVTPTYYAASDVPLAQTLSDTSDSATSYFLHTIMRHDYGIIAEIGAYDGQRIRTLKRLLPHIAATGLDIVPGYRDQPPVDGVTFRPFDAAFFGAGPQGAAVVCRGTLCCFEPEELRGFLCHLAANRWALAFVEPATPFAVRESVRRSKGSWYHPYGVVLEDAGFDVLEAELPDDGFSLSMMECWMRGHARPVAGPAGSG